MSEKRALGRGLGALIPPAETESSSHEKVLQIPVMQIKTSKYQPRVEFNEEKLTELVNSIKGKGVVQPILVRKAQDGYELIAGERRLRAVKRLGFANIPAIVKNVDDLDMLEMALIENIQREELNAIEEARAFERFITEFSFTQEKIAAVLGKDRSTVANALRLLGLPTKIQEYIAKNMITAGHAKAVLGLATDHERVRLCNLIIKKGLSVRETEGLVTRRSSGSKKKTAAKDTHITDIESSLRQSFGTRVRIIRGKKRGRIQIEYYSEEDLNRILDILFRRSPAKAAAEEPVADTTGSLGFVN